MNFFTEEQWINWVDQLAEEDYVVIDHFLSEEHFSQIMSFFSKQIDQNQLRKAGIGPSTEYQIEESVRGDLIYWLDENRDEAMRPFFNLADETRSQLNKLCYLSLSGFEFHLAKYPPNSFYKKHLDQFKSRNNRMISMIIYLNKKWKEGDGGELVIYKDTGNINVNPIANRCVLFKSADILHEVLLTTKPRLSVTGWLLYLPPQLGPILPT